MHSACRDKPLLETSHVTALKKMGAVLIGKTNMHEIGIGVTGVNNVWGTPMNPWGENRYPGGSSSGAGASTGAGLCPISIGGYRRLQTHSMFCEWLKWLCPFSYSSTLSEQAQMVEAPYEFPVPLMDVLG